MDKARLVCDGRGAGGFLSPPGYPTQTCRIETDLRRRPENRGSMSLDYAVREGRDQIDQATVRAAKEKLRSWFRSKPLLTDPAVRDWIHQVLGYFRSMYVNLAAPVDHQWDASTMVVDAKRDPLQHEHEHAGAHFIRKFYSGYHPTADDFAQAYWGMKER